RKVRVINVVELMKLQPEAEHPHGLSDSEFDALFTSERPVIFAYHGYPTLIHRLTYRRTNHHNIHVRGYKEEGTTTTPFDMVMLNDLHRFHIVMDLIDRVPGLGAADAVGHRIVHGGERFREPVRVDAEARSALAELADLAPLHQAGSLAALDAVAALLPNVASVACFDTAFHATLPEAARTY